LDKIAGAGNNFVQLNPLIMKQLNVPGSRRWLLALGFILFACFLGAPLYAQMVSGKVIDAATGEALLGVTISETGTRNGTITDVNGAYSLRLTNANATLNFSIVGYSPRFAGC
jgi:hypothetical protein